MTRIQVILQRLQISSENLLSFQFNPSVILLIVRNLATLLEMELYVMIFFTDGYEGQYYEGL